MNIRICDRCKRCKDIKKYWLPLRGIESFHISELCENCADELFNFLESKHFYDEPSWFVITKNPEDTDYNLGSFDLEKAKEGLNQYRNDFKNSYITGVNLKENCIACKIDS